ncbi:molecular chaperone DnaJ [Sphingomonas oleivorans]|uniref:Molecular chaperone DnaJ n=1 Tax=Sphingomonas oleivorans TaxID=1735121 RepID=A0A2T5FXP6_9SPHN|nr:DnaJ C-terminal domain-containing protein [Sphingomonas oleivorans]PTQ10899.1 molecular chaperone DnaJ [Sphingomonas oleivorans]
MADLYSRLGVPRNADDATIKTAYRKLAKELHPDRNRDNPKAAARFAEVTAAYDLLTDRDKRAQYDRGEIDEHGNPKMPFGYGAGAAGGAGGFRRGHPGQGGASFEFGGEGVDFGDIFEGLFGGRGGRAGAAGPGGGFGGGFRQRAAAKGADVSYRLAVPFEEAAALKPQRITLASGKTIDLKITADAVSGTPMRLAGQGDEGPGGRGDAIVTIEVKPHRFFRRDGDDVRIDLPIRLDEAVKGARVKVPTVEGAVMLNIPEGANSGKVLRLKDRGFHRKDGTRGYQYVTLMVDIPPDDPALRQFVESWEADHARNPRAALGV